MYRIRTAAIFLVVAIVFIPVIIGAILTNRDEKPRPVPIENR